MDLVFVFRYKIELVFVEKDLGHTVVLCKHSRWDWHAYMLLCILFSLSLPSSLSFLLPLSLPLFPFLLPEVTKKIRANSIKNLPFRGRYRLEFAKLSTRTRNKLQNFTNNVLVLSSHTLEHVGINGRVKGKEYLFLHNIPLKLSLQFKRLSHSFLWSTKSIAKANMTTTLLCSNTTQLSVLEIRHTTSL